MRGPETKSLPFTLGVRRSGRVNKFWQGRDLVQGLEAAGWWPGLRSLRAAVTANPCWRLGWNPGPHSPSLPSADPQHGRLGRCLQRSSSLGEGKGVQGSCWEPDKP